MKDPMLLATFTLLEPQLPLQRYGVLRVVIKDSRGNLQHNVGGLTEQAPAWLLLARLLAAASASGLLATANGKHFVILFVSPWVTSCLFEKLFA